MTKSKTFVQRMEDLRKGLQKKNSGFYVTGKYNKIRKKSSDCVHIIPFQELYIGSLTLSPGYGTVLYNLGKMSGEYTTIQSLKYLKLGSLVERLMKMIGPYGIMKRESLTKNIINSWKTMGYGQITIKKVDGKNKKIVFIVEESVFAAGVKNVGERICFNQAGMLAGILKGISGKEFYTVETKCIANGDKYCEFEVHEEETYELKE